MKTTVSAPRIALAALAAVTFAAGAFGHGDVKPQAVDVSKLPALDEDILFENPYRAETAGEEVWRTAIEIGASGYNQNCARCHGLAAVSGGLAPDLRYLEASDYDDEWYMERYVHGYTAGGVTRMPGFGELLGQEAGWAIRTYIETRPDDDSMEAAAPELTAIRDELAAESADAAATSAKLHEIATTIETYSTAPVADSIALRAAELLESDPTAQKAAAEILTVGLSAAK